MTDTTTPTQLPGSTGHGPVQRYLPSQTVEQPNPRYYINGHEVTKRDWDKFQERYNGNLLELQRARMLLPDIEHQPAPVAGEKAVPVTVYVEQDLRDKSKAGTKKYGTPLHTDNGRNALADAYQEALDLCQYLKQVLLEQRSHQGLPLQELDSDLEIALERDQALMELHRFKSSPAALLQQLLKLLWQCIKK